MGHEAPKVYIDDVLMDDLATDDMPVLSGLSLDYGVDNHQDMQGVESCSFEMLIQEPKDLSFLEIGNTVAVLHIPANSPNPATDANVFTYFVGRIARCSARRDPNKSGALRVSIQAVDFTADLENIELFNVNISATEAFNRWGRLGDLIANKDWSTSTWPLRWPSAVHAQLVYKQASYLSLVDMFLRAQIMFRYNTSSYVPTSGPVKRLVFAQDVSNAGVVDALMRDSSGAWRVDPRAPDTQNGGTVAITLNAYHFLEGSEWVKEPEDVITDVTLQRIDPYNGTDDSKRTPINSANHIDTSAIRSRFGERALEFDTDWPAGTAVGQMVPLFDHWLSTTSKWRIKNLKLRDTSMLTITQIRQLMSPEFRFRTWLNVNGLPDNRPERTYSISRGVVLGGQATWIVPDSDRDPYWDLGVTIGRDDLTAAPGADTWTFSALQSSPFKDDTFITITSELTAADFTRIGEP